VLGHDPCEAQVGHLLSGRLHLRHDARALGPVGGIARLHQQAAGDGTQLEPGPGRTCLQEAQPCLGAQHLEGAVVETRGDHYLGEDLHDEARRGPVADGVEGDDPPERRRPIALESAPVRVADIAPHRNAAGVRVLDDRRGGPGELPGEPPGRVRVEQVVVGELLAVQLLRGRDAGAGPIQGRPLVRVLAVPQARGLLGAHEQRLG
jgi:hypothetical protein